MVQVGGGLRPVSVGGGPRPNDLNKSSSPALFVGAVPDSTTPSIAPLLELLLDRDTGSPPPPLPLHEEEKAERKSGLSALDAAPSP